MTYYAHSLKDDPNTDRWQKLADHLQAVAQMAGSFARQFQAEDWGHNLGMLHDIGKGSQSFQTYLLRCQEKDYHEAELKGHIDHSSAGAQRAVALDPVLGHLLAYPAAGHHAGLLDAVGEGASLDNRLKKKVDDCETAARELPPMRSLRLPVFLEDDLRRRGSEPKQVAFSFGFFVRMLFSCLVDADFLDTERFLDSSRALSRPRWPPDMLKRMDEQVESYVAGEFAETEDPVDVERRRVRQDCIRAADSEPGLFSLTVPTGGGKTLSSLAFGLRHARLRGLTRIIYVIPFTSIIEQNAEVFRKVFAPLQEQGLSDPVLEHHSAIDTGKETAESRLAAENWDAPLVITTSVQFYESLFAHRTSRCRKLHNISRSVIILDEVQKIPVDYLEPCLLALRELSAHYGCTVVLCTATQPALHHRMDFPIGLKNIREIVPEPHRLYAALKRVEIQNLGRLDDSELACRLNNEAQALCIVNTRRHAREIFNKLKGGTNSFHLSASMCPCHRTEVLNQIRRSLENRNDCRVISTQIVEAGVDLDFPIVFRSLAGLDSIAQAAGRCNRNGQLPRGITYLFWSEHGTCEAFLRDTVNACIQIAGSKDMPPLYDDLLSLEAVGHYFRLYFWDQQARWDNHGVLDGLRLVNDKALPFLFAFRSISEDFQLIQDTGKPVIVPWGEEGRNLCDELRKRPRVGLGNLLRRLQRYTVQIPNRVWNREIVRSIELIHEVYPVLISPEIHYHPAFGLCFDDLQTCPDAFMV